jgi:hypothetical protein
MLAVRMRDYHGILRPWSVRHVESRGVRSGPGIARGWLRPQQRPTR